MIIGMQAAPGARLPLGVRAPLQALGARLRPGALRVQIVAADDPMVRRLNREFRGMDRSTDVLSFVYESKPRRDADDADAEIYISIPVAKRQARQRDHALGDEFLILALHGLLHIQGYDHHGPTDERRMRAAEQRHLRWLESSWPQWKPRRLLGSSRQERAGR